MSTQHIPSAVPAYKSSPSGPEENLRLEALKLSIKSFYGEERTTGAFLFRATAFHDWLTS